MKQLRKIFTITILLVASPLYASSDHEQFDNILKENVSPTGHVNYPGIQSDPRFGQYLEYLANTDPETFSSKEEKLAFWINAYNALAIKGILDGKSPSSFFSRIGYFKTTEYDLAGQKINLYDLERDIIIPFNEPRIHFAIVCASASCPKLIPEAYTAEKLEDQLEKNTKAFINNTFKNKFDPSNKKAEISKIFDWFTKDFATHSGSIQKYLAQYVEDSSIAELLSDEIMHIRFMKYNWTLNGTSIK